MVDLMCSQMSPQGWVRPFHPDNGFEFTFQELHTLLGGPPKVFAVKNSVGYVIVANALACVDPLIPVNQRATEAVGGDLPIVGTCFYCHRRYLPKSMVQAAMLPTLE
jgi:hypothetical protein